MFCCKNCFSDEFLKNVISANSNKRGKCSFCGSLNVERLHPELLFDRFEPLLDLYQVNDRGKNIVELIQRDWKVFAFPDAKAQQRMLRKITGSGALIKSKFKPKYLQDKKNIELWKDFREELKHKNRFFPDGAPDRDQIELLRMYIRTYIKKGSQVFYRSRINNQDKPYPPSNMGKPPLMQVGNGRANPIGIPYLYVASTIDTAISEIRGHKGERVTVAEFQLLRDLELADLRDPKNKISPFELNEEDEVALIYKNMPFLEHLGNELSRPVIPSEANLEYLPSQYLCELLKQIGFHGIIYKSSISDGNNYVIFSDKKLKPIKTFQYEITETSIKTEKID
jgi:RES domain-containing protein